MQTTTKSDVSSSDIPTHPVLKKHTIDNHILKVVKDVMILKKNARKFCYTANDMVPPLTCSYVNFNDTRMIHLLNEKLRERIVNIETKEKERNDEFDEVKHMCDSYVEMLTNFEPFIAQNIEKKNRTLKQKQESVEVIKKCTEEVHRYIKAAECLLFIKDEMKRTIDENTCYLTYLEDVVNQSADYSSSQMIVYRYEELTKEMKGLIDGYYKMLNEIEEVKQNMSREKCSNEAEIHAVLQKRQKLDYDLKEIRARSQEYEMALNKMHEETYEQVTKINDILTTIGQHVDRLIKSGAAPESLRTQTLAIQVDAIRDNFLRQKDICRRYNDIINRFKLSRDRAEKRIDQRHRLIKQALAKSSKTRLKESSLKVSPLKTEVSKHGLTKAQQEGVRVLQNYINKLKMKKILKSKHHQHLSTDQTPKFKPLASTSGKSINK